MGFYHTSSEVWQLKEVYDGMSTLRICADGEDPVCSKQVNTLEWSVSDHLHNYLGSNEGAEGC